MKIITAMYEALLVLILFALLTAPFIFISNIKISNFGSSSLSQNTNSK